MKYKTRDGKSLKERVSQLYLNLSEKLPKTKISFIDELKYFRENQKKGANEYLEKSKRPKDNDLSLHSFYLFEIFLTEDFSELRKSLDSLFAKGPSSSYLTHYQSFLDNAFNRTGFSYCNLPLIVRKDVGFIPSVRIYLENIPYFIKFIELKLIQFLPSFIVMRIHLVIDKERVNNEINKVIDGYFQERIIFRSYFPWKSGLTMFPPDKEKIQACQNILVRLKLETEEFLSNYFTGFYLSNRKKHDKNCCPFLEIYLISQISSDLNLKEWLWAGKEFWQLLGFNYIHEKIWYTNDEFIFYINPLNEVPFTDKLIINTSTINVSANQNLSNEIDKRASEFCEEFIASMSLLSFFSFFYENIKKLKTSFFLLAKKLRKVKFDELIHLQEIVSMNHMKIDNIFAEFEKIPSSEIKTNKIELKDLNQDRILADVFLDNINYIMDNINTLFEPVTSYVKEYFQNKSVYVNYRLQRALKFLTILLCVFAFLQFSSPIIKFIKTIFSFIVSQVKSFGI